MNIEQIYEDMKELGYPIAPLKPIYRIDNAYNWFHFFMKYAVERTGKEYTPMPVYDEVIDWLSDNKGKGLLLYGNCGLGKTLIARYVIGPIYSKVLRKVVNYHNATDLKDLDKIIDKQIICLDDIGTESTINKYGNKFDAVSEILDRAEKENKLLILTSNLTAEDLKARYGDRIFDRILATTKRVLFTGKSFRS